MAKATKVAPKHTSTSSKSSVVKKKGLLGRSFNLQSRRVQFFVVILIVAILGGGYFTYKSFAATSVQFTPTEIYTRIGGGNNGYLVTELQQGAKKNTQVFESASNFSAQLHSDVTPNYIQRMDPVLRASKGMNARICLYARGSGGHTRIRVSSSGYADTNFSQELVFGPDGYVLQCTAPFVISPSRIDLFGARAGDISHQKIDGASYRLGYISFEVL